MIRKLLIIALLLAGASAHAGNYYVSPLGSDSGTGTIESPWRTISHAMSAIPQPTGDRHILYIAEGYYEENFIFRNKINVYGGFNENTWDRKPEWHPTYIKKIDWSPFQTAPEMILDGIIIHGSLVCSSGSPQINNVKILMGGGNGLTIGDGASPLISDCDIRQCAEYGILALNNSTPDIENTVSAFNGMDGIGIQSSRRININHVTVAHNAGAGISAPVTSDIYIDNSIIWKNNDDLVNCHTWHSCVSDGDTNPGNSTADPMFFGWGGFSEFTPLHVSVYGSHSGAGSSNDPLRHLREAWNKYSFILSEVSPHIDKAHDQTDRGAYPEPEDYLSYFGNTGYIQLLPGTYYEYNIISTIPVTIAGLPGYENVISSGFANTFFWKTSGKISSLTIKDAWHGIFQPEGSLSLDNVTVTSCRNSGASILGGEMSVTNSNFENSANGVHARDALVTADSCRFSGNGGSGLYLEDDTQSEIVGSEISSNNFGVTCNGHTSLSLKDCILNGNFSAAVEAGYDSNPTIFRSHIYQNKYGLIARDNSRFALYACTIYDQDETGIDLSGNATGKIYHNTICYNNSGINVITTGDVSVKNCIVRDNPTSNIQGVTPVFSNVQGISSGEGNIDADPAFTDPAARDFHLSGSSPCIDAGIDTGGCYEDIDGDYMPMGSAPDMGSDETEGVWGFSFEGGKGSWNFISATGFTPPVENSSGGRLSLSSQNNINTFGMWTSEAEACPLEKDYLYRVKFTVSGEGGELRRSPLLRLRAQSADTQWVRETDIFSAWEKPVSPPQAGRNYDLFFTLPDRERPFPSELQDCGLVFDMVNMDSNDSPEHAFHLDNLEIARIKTSDIPAMSRIKQYEFMYHSEGWTSGGAPPFYTLPDFSYSNGALLIKSANNFGCFGYWFKSLDDVEFQEDSLYRFDFTLRTDVPADTAPSIRFRINSEDDGAVQMLMLNSKADASVSLQNYDRVYSVYFIPFAEHTLDGNNHLTISVDMINFDNEDAPKAFIAIERIEIYSGEIPSAFR